MPCGGVRENFYFHSIWGGRLLPPAGFATQEGIAVLIRLASAIARKSVASADAHATGFWNHSTKSGRWYSI